MLIVKNNDTLMVEYDKSNETELESIQEFSIKKPHEIQS